MKAYVVCGHVEHDSYHSLRMVTLDRYEAVKYKDDFNARAFQGDILYHMHTVPLHGRWAARWIRAIPRLMSRNVRFDRPPQGMLQ